MSKSIVFIWKKPVKTTNWLCTVVTLPLLNPLKHLRSKRNFKLIPLRCLQTAWLMILVHLSEWSTVDHQRRKKVFTFDSGANTLNVDSKVQSNVYVKLPHTLTIATTLERSLDKSRFINRFRRNYQWPNDDLLFINGNVSIEWFPLRGILTCIIYTHEKKGFCRVEL